MNFWNKIFTAAKVRWQPVFAFVVNKLKYECILMTFSANAVYDHKKRLLHFGDVLEGLWPLIIQKIMGQVSYELLEVWALGSTYGVMFYVLCYSSVLEKSEGSSNVYFYLLLSWINNILPRTKLIRKHRFFRSLHMYFWSLWTTNVIVCSFVLFFVRKLLINCTSVSKEIVILKTSNICIEFTVYEIEALNCVFILISSLEDLNV